MFRPRVIPVLLLRDKGLVKSTAFKNHRYIGDPINAVKVFNDLGADELIFLDIDATREGRSIDPELIRKIGDEAYMPFAVGGGIDSIQSIKALLKAGAEKVLLTSVALKNPEFVREASAEFGSSTIAVGIDVNKNLFGKPGVYGRSASQASKYHPVEFATLMENMGAGELMVTAVYKEGHMKGYDIELLNQISTNVSIPVIANGGASGMHDFELAIKQGFASAVAAASMFIYHGPKKAVLINYPSIEQLDTLIGI